MSTSHKIRQTRADAPDYLTCAAELPQPTQCWFCTYNRKYGPTFLGHFGAGRLPAPHLIGVDNMKNPAALPQGSEVREKRPPPDDFSDVPELYEHLTATTYDDGAARETSTLTVFLEGATLKVCLNDRSQQRTLFVTGSTLGECWDALEKRLRQGEDADWRPWKTKKSRN